MFINPIALVSEKSQMPKLRRELLQPNEEQLITFNFIIPETLKNNVFTKTTQLP